MVIEGLGDEVLFFFGCVGLVVIGMVSWWSSNVVDVPMNWVQHVQVVGLASNDAPVVSARNNATEAQTTSGDAADGVREEPPGDGGGGSDPATESAGTRSEEENQENDLSDDEAADRVNIKLKFLNDTQKEVKASLTQRLGRFKRKHFAPEISENKRIRLIFNGHVLGSDHLTLNEVGLFDNCVVHCLISAGAPSPPAGSAAAAAASGSGSTAAPSAETVHNIHEMEDLDLSHMAYPFLGSILLVIWYCQWVYSHFFSFTSSLSLLSLTCLYMASLVNTYLH